MASEFASVSTATSMAVTVLETHVNLQDGHTAITDARIKVMRAWNEVQHDLDRLQASMPFQVPLRRQPSYAIKAQLILDLYGLSTVLGV